SKAETKTASTQTIAGEKITTYGGDKPISNKEGGVSFLDNRGKTTAVLTENQIEHFQNTRSHPRAKEGFEMAIGFNKDGAVVAHKEFYLKTENGKNIDLNEF